MIGDKKTRFKAGFSFYNSFKKYENTLKYTYICFYENNERNKGIIFEIF